MRIIKPTSIEDNPKNRICPSDILTNLSNVSLQTDGDKNGIMPSMMSTKAIATARLPKPKLIKFQLY